jgi:hypothetical protein
VSVRTIGIFRAHGGIYQENSSAPQKYPNQLPFEIEQLIVRLKKEKPKW